MSKTTAELATAVLRRLRVIGINDTASAARATAVTEFYANAYQELEYSDLGFWTEDAIEERAFNALVDVIAGQMAPSFGLERPGLEDKGLRRIRILAAEIPDGTIHKGTYY